MIEQFLEIQLLNLMYNLFWAPSSTKMRLSGIFKGARYGFNVLTAISGESMSPRHLLLGNKSGRQTFVDRITEISGCRGKDIANGSDIFLQVPSTTSAVHMQAMHTKLQYRPRITAAYNPKFPP